jgi:hypothetical protein
MPDYAIPGVYVAEQQYSLNPLKIDTRCLAAFAGIAERGPLHAPSTVRSFDEYLRVFGGFDTAGTLPFAVYNFFKCGGAECMVVRIADAKTARCATVDVRCLTGAARFEARSAGHWGNYVTCRVWHETESLGESAAVDAVSGAWVEVSRSGLEKGDVLKIASRGQPVLRSVKAVEGRRAYLSKPARSLCRADGEAGPAVKLDRVHCSIALSCKGKTETYVHLSANPASDRYFVDYVNARSSLCSVTAELSAGLPQPVFSAVSGGGADGIAELSAGDFIGSYEGPHFSSGIGCFETSDEVSLVAVPDAFWLLGLPGKARKDKLEDVFAVQSALVSQAERFPGRFAILDIPTGFDPVEALEWRNRFDSPHAAAYYPSIDVIDPLDPMGAKTVRVPPSGAVAGCIVATDGEKGIFHAPANVVIQGAAGVSRMVSDGEFEILYPRGVNVLKYFPGKGIKIWGARTLSSNADWRYINVRRTFSRICTSLKRGTQWAVFEPNNRSLRKKLVRQVSGFLLDLWMGGYLAGSTAEQGFFVRCDDELNPPENIDNGLLTFEVGVAIVRPTEFFTITITAEKEGASVYIEDE